MPCTTFLILRTRCRVYVDLSYRKRLNLASELDEVAFKLHTWSDHALAAMLAGAGAVVMEEVDEDSPIEASALKTTIESRWAQPFFGSSVSFIFFFFFFFFVVFFLKTLAEI